MAFENLLIGMHCLTSNSHIMKHDVLCGRYWKWVLWDMRSQLGEGLMNGISGYGVVFCIADNLTGSKITLETNLWACVRGIL